MACVRASSELSSRQGSRSSSMGERRRVRARRSMIGSRAHVRCSAVGDWPLQVLGELRGAFEDGGFFCRVVEATPIDSFFNVVVSGERL
eukprot:3238014-Pyramimonas_sp.AAC.2